MHARMAGYIYRYHRVIDLSIIEKKVPFTSGTRFTKSCLSQVDNKQVDLWHQSFSHLSACSMAKMQKENMATWMSLPSVIFQNIKVVVACVKHAFLGSKVVGPSS